MGVQDCKSAGSESSESLSQEMGDGAGFVLGFENQGRIL